MKIIFTAMLIVVLSSARNLEFLQGHKTLNDKYCAEGIVREEKSYKG